MNRVIGEAVGIAGIGMATRDTEDPVAADLPPCTGPCRAGTRSRIGWRKNSAPCWASPVVDQTVGEPLDQSIQALRCLPQDGTIRARVLLIKCDDEGLLEGAWEEDSLWYRVGHYVSASGVAKGVSAQPLYHMGAFVFQATSSAS